MILIFLCFLDISLFNIHSIFFSGFLLIHNFSIRFFIHFYITLFCIKHFYILLRLINILYSFIFIFFYFYILFLYLLIFCFSHFYILFNFHSFPFLSILLPYLSIFICNSFIIPLFCIILKFFYFMLFYYYFIFFFFFL